MCLYPLKAVSFKYYSNNELITKIKLMSNRDRFIEQNKNVFLDIQKIDLPCKKCFECERDNAITWSYRVYCESLLYKENCFVTLTYSDDNKLLNKRDLQLFIKRLRKYLGSKKIRYFACGEYGSKKMRPHYHIIIFNWSPPDKKKFYETKKGDVIYLSNILENLWGHGFITIGDVSIESSKYCCKYMQKMLFNDNKKKVFKFLNLQSPFLLMSKKPGIGYNFFINNLDLLDTDKIYTENGYVKLPRYFLNVAEKEFGLYLDELKQNRKIKAKIFALNDEELNKRREKISNFLTSFKK